VAWSFDLNNASAAFNVAVFDLKALLVAASWTVIESSTKSGGTYSPNNGDILTTSALVDGIDTTSGLGAWFRMRDPAGVREFIIQRRTDPTGAPTFGLGTQLLWYVKYSPLGRFTTGATAASPPTATDEIIIDDAEINIGQRRLTGRYDIVAGGAAEGHSFLLVMRTSATGVVTSCLGLDVLTEAAAEDADPALFVSMSAVSGAAQWTNPETQPFFDSINVPRDGNGAWGWLYFGEESAQALQYQPLQLAAYNQTSGLVDAVLGTATVINGYNTEVDMVPLLWGRTVVDGSNQATLPGIKGASRIFQMNSPSAVTNCDTTTGLTRMFLACMSIPWDGSTAPVL